MGSLLGKVALITGAARGQGRSHALKFADEGADIVLVDSCAEIAAASYEMPTLADLEETAQLVEKRDRRALARRVDVRDQAELDAVVAEAVDELGGIDVVVANAGIVAPGRLWELDDRTWNDTIEVNLTGVWRTIRATVPVMIEAGRGGSIILVSSVAGTKGLENVGA